MTSHFVFIYVKLNMAAKQTIKVISSYNVLRPWVRTSDQTEVSIKAAHQEKSLKINRKTNSDCQADSGLYDWLKQARIVFCNISIIQKVGGVHQSNYMKMWGTEGATSPGDARCGQGPALPAPPVHPWASFLEWLVNPGTPGALGGASCLCSH